MGKIELITPEVVRVAYGAARNIDFRLNFNDYDAITSSGTITIKASSTPDFSNPDVVTKPSFSHKDRTGTAWSSVTGNTVAFNLQGKDLRVSLDNSASEVVQYVKVVFTVGSKVFESRPIMFTSLTELTFTMNEAITIGTVRPEKVLVMDKINAVLTSAFTIKVEVTNNAKDTTPVWENATTAYLNNDYYTFTNKTKTNANPWAISVKYYIKKNNASDSIEVSELFVAFV